MVDLEGEGSEAIHARFELLRKDPQAYLDLTTRMIERDPNSTRGYYARHFGWLALGDYSRALLDLDRYVEIKPSSSVLYSRGHVLMKMGRFHEALDDFRRGETMDPTPFNLTWGPLYESYCHARLGDFDGAIAACEKLFDDQEFEPRDPELPRGTKSDIIAEYRRQAKSQR